MSKETEGKRKGTNQKSNDLSLVVAGTGLEPMTFGL